MLPAGAAAATSGIYYIRLRDSESFSLKAFLLRRAKRKPNAAAPCRRGRGSEYEPNILHEYAHNVAHISWFSIGFTHRIS